MLRHCFRALLIMAVTYPAMGCVALVNYSPNTNILSEIGLHQGQTLLGEILTRCRNPRIVDVEVTSDYFAFMTPHRPGWWVMIGNRATVYFNNIERVDIYANDRVMVYDLSGRRIAQFDFLTPTDSLRFTDLVHAFRDAGTNWPAPHHNPEPRDDYVEPPPPPAAPPPREDENTRNVLEPDPHEEDPLMEKPPPAVEPIDPGDDEENTRNLLDED